MCRRAVRSTFNLQQQLPGHLSFQVNYVGAKTTRLEVNHNLNLLPAQYYNQGPAGITYLNTPVANPLAGRSRPTQTLTAARFCGASGRLWWAGGFFRGSES